MLRVGLTGDLGSGKSTVARMLAERGAVVFSADEIGRAMMQPGHPVFDAIVEHFGEGVLQPNGELDRRELARLAFVVKRVEELNAIVHPAVLAEQARAVAELAVTQPGAIVVVESALIFTTVHTSEGRSWHERFDRILLVTAPTEAKVARFVARVKQGRGVIAEDRKTLMDDARRRLAAQSSTKEHEAECLVIRNDAGLADLREQVNVVWKQLQKLSR